MPIKATFKPDRSGIRRAAHSEGVYRELERRADRVITAAGFSVIERSGEYREGLRRDRIRLGRNAAVRVTATAPHSATLEHGSRPHIIEPRTKKALAWPGAQHPVARVHHPGTQARHTLRNALKAARR